MDDELPITQTPEVLTLSPTSKSLFLEPKDVWGRLFPMVSILLPEGKYTGVDMSRSKILYGS